MCQTASFPEARSIFPLATAHAGETIELLPPLTLAEGRQLALHVAVDIESGADMRIGATKGNRFADGPALDQRRAGVARPEP